LVCTIITPSHIVCANVGDSRCVLGQKSKVVALTEDHKPSIIEEKNRIEKAVGFVRFDRVNGELAMSRAIGDFRYKMNATLELHEHLVICLPDISIQERNKHEDETLILACDGVWDVISNEEVSNRHCLFYSSHFLCLGHSLC
jgi:serine/threonine protein phosphatase PrpC